MNTENRIAAEKQMPSPVYQTKQETDDNYNSCASLLLDNIDIASFMIASHNRKSIELIVDEITRSFFLVLFFVCKSLNLNYQEEY